MLLLIFLSLQKKGSMRTNYYADDFKRARWDCLDRLLSDGIPRTMDTLIRLTKNELAKVIGNSRFSISTATFRNDIDEFRSALEKAGKGDMLVRERYVAINGEVNSDRRKRTYCYREKGFRAMGYLNNAKAITSTEEVTDAVIAKLDEFDDVYIGQNLKFVFSEIKPTTADLYAITFTTDGLVYIMSKCSTEEGGTQYVESLIAPIYVSDSGEVFVSYSSDEPLITFDASYDQKFTSGYASGDFLVVG